MKRAEWRQTLCIVQLIHRDFSLLSCRSCVVFRHNCKKKNSFHNSNSMLCSLVYTAWIYSGAENCTCCCHWSSSVFFCTVNAALTKSMKATWPHIISSYCGVEFQPIKMNSRWHKLPRTGLVIYQADICQEVGCQGAESKESAHYSKVWTSQRLSCFPPYIGTLCLGYEIICLNPAECKMITVSSIILTGYHVIMAMYVLGWTVADGLMKCLDGLIHPRW